MRRFKAPRDTISARIAKECHLFNCTDTARWQPRRRRRRRRAFSRVPERASGRCAVFRIFIGVAQRDRQFLTWPGNLGGNFSLRETRRLNRFYEIVGSHALFALRFSASARAYSLDGRRAHNSLNRVNPLVTRRPPVDPV